jgi:hypothetical protein
VRQLLACLAVVALLAGCGGSGSHWSDAACRAQADKVVAHADSMLLHYGGGTVYPADMSYLGLKSSLGRFDKGSCPDDTLGSKLRRSLSSSERKTLLQLLPRASAARIRNALSAT